MQTQRILEMDGQVEAVGGLHLYYRGWEADEPCATLIVTHGLSEHSGRYAEFGRAMAAFGISTYALDLRGHGLSEGRRGHVDHFHVLLQDLDRFRREIACIARGEEPQFLLGHSMGGLITARYVEEYEPDIAGAVIISPWLATAMPVPRWKVLAASFLNRVLPALPINAGIDEQWLSHDQQVIRRYRDDVLVHGRITPRLFTEASAAMGLVLQRSDRIRIPLLLLLAGDDRIVDTNKSEAFARSLTAADVTIRVYPDYYHEVLNDHDRAIAQHEIRDWILARLPDRQS
jgi:acylglycerol lipase